jgi:hypothetical protein
MIQTSHYQKSGSLPNAVGISQGVPKWYKGELYKKLAPPWEIVKIENEATFRLPGQFCHRRLVAEWLEKNLLIEVLELDVPKAASPRSIQRELWSFL